MIVEITAPIIANEMMDINLEPADAKQRPAIKICGAKTVTVDLFQLKKSIYKFHLFRPRLLSDPVFSNDRPDDKRNGNNQRDRPERHHSTLDAVTRLL